MSDRHVLSQYHSLVTILDGESATRPINSLDKDAMFSGVGGGCRGESAPKNFWFVENPGKIPENMGTFVITVW